MNQAAPGTRILEVGNNLPVVTKAITQEKISRYADASGDHNPVHIDPEYAGTTTFGGTIAHGMLILAYISEMMTAAFGGWWDTTGLKVRFHGPARPGDTVSTSGRVIRVEERRGTRVTICELEAKNQKGDILVSGTAKVWRW
jgi:3-hydroxybutyryl-CoA dehydratase